MKYTATIDGRQVDIEFERAQPPGAGLQARIGDRVYSLEVDEVEPGVYWFNWNNRSIEVAVTPSQDGYGVSINGHHVNVEILDARSALKKAAQHGHAGLVEIKAPMPGKIVRLLVGEGAEVNANQGLLVMEAMKMQNEIKSPKKGIVKRLAVSEGLAVNSGDLLVAVE